nr:uncharacterized protein LOC117273262 isoform X2 [Nicotiana tomentosiformis]
MVCSWALPINPQMRTKLCSSRIKISHNGGMDKAPTFVNKSYDKSILEQMDNRVGKLLKIDTYTSSTLRGRYARICVQVLLDIPITTNITIGTHNQSLVYEGEGILCTGCVSIFHTLRSYEFIFIPTQENRQATPTAGSSSDATTKDQSSQWCTIGIARIFRTL